MSDPVALAIIQGVVTIIGTIATVVTTRRSRRRIEEASRREHANTRAAIAGETSALVDVLPRPSFPVDVPVARDPHRDL